MHHTGTFASKVRYFLCFLGEGLGMYICRAGLRDVLGSGLDLLPPELVAHVSSTH